jgi:hypothetical protein
MLVGSLKKLATIMVIECSTPSAAAVGSTLSCDESSTCLLSIFLGKISPTRCFKPLGAVILSQLGFIAFV